MSVAKIVPNVIDSQAGKVASQSDTGNDFPGVLTDLIGRVESSSAQERKKTPETDMDQGKPITLQEKGPDDDLNEETETATPLAGEQAYPVVLAEPDATTLVQIAGVEGESFSTATGEGQNVQIDPDVLPVAATGGADETGQGTPSGERGPSDGLQFDGVGISALESNVPGTTDSQDATAQSVVPSEDAGGAVTGSPSSPTNEPVRNPETPMPIEQTPKLTERAIARSAVKSPEQGTINAASRPETHTEKSPAPAPPREGREAVPHEPKEGGDGPRFTVNADASNPVERADATFQVGRISDSVPIRQGASASDTGPVAPTNPTRGTAADIEPSHVISQIVRGVRMTRRDGQTSMSLRLEPPSLGSVQLDVTMGREGVHVNMRVETEAVRQVLSSNLPELREALGREGLGVEEFSFSFQEHTGSPAWEQEEAGSSGERFPSDLAGANAQQEEARPRGATPLRSVNPAGGRVDFFV